MERSAILRRVWIIAACALAAGLWLRLFLDPSERPNFSDFNVYWVAGSKAARHLTVYDVEGHYQFKYSPFVALLWALPTGFRSSYLWARLHYVATGIGWYALLYCLAKRVDARRAWLLWAAGAAVFSVAIRDELKLGQVNLWPFLLVLPAWFYGPRPVDQRGADRAGFWIGAAWGLAIQWKLYALLLGPIWLLRRRTAVFSGALAVTLLTLGAAMALAHGPDFAWAENLRWLESLTASSQSLLVSQYNVSLLGVLGKFAARTGLAFGSWAYVLWFACLVLGLWVVLWAERRSRASADWFWSASFAWALIDVVNPLVWPYWQLLVVPLFLVYFARGTGRGWAGDHWSFWPVVIGFTALNWLQNYPIVQLGAGLPALLALLASAYLQARTRAPDREAEIGASSTRA